MSRNKMTVVLINVALVLLMGWPLNTYAGSTGNQGEVEFYYEDNQPPQKLEDGSPSKFSQPPSKVLSLPQTGEKMSSYSSIGFGFIVTVIWFWKRRGRKEGKCDD